MSKGDAEVNDHVGLTYKAKENPMYKRTLQRTGSSSHAAVVHHS